MRFFLLCLLSINLNKLLEFRTLDGGLTLIRNYTLINTDVLYGFDPFSPNTSGRVARSRRNRTSFVKGDKDGSGGVKVSQAEGLNASDESF